MIKTVMEKEQLPAEDETIAAKRIARVEQKIAASQERIFTNRAWWSNGPAELLVLLLLSGLNFYLIYPLFNTASIGTSFSGPAIPFMAQIITFLTGAPLAYSIRGTEIILFLLFPITTYVLIKTLVNRKLVAIISVLILTLPDLLFAQTRINNGFLGSDGPHIASLGIISLAIYALIIFLRKGSIANLIMAAGLDALVILISPFGFVAYKTFAIMVVFSEMLLGEGRLKAMRFIIVMITAAALVAFWYNPAFALWIFTGPVGQEIRVTIINLLPVSLFALPIFGTFGFLLFDRRPDLQPLFLASFWTIIFLMIVFVGKISFTSTDSMRYLPELGISLAFLLAVIIQRLIDILKDINVSGIPWLSQPAFSNPLITLILILLTARIIMARESMIIDIPDATAVWTSPGKGAIWFARDNLFSASGVLGYIITGIGLVILVLLGVRAQIEKIKSKRSQKQPLFLKIKRLKQL